MYKKFTIILLISTISSLILIIFYNYQKDSFYQYHLPKNESEIYLDNELYQNGGMLKNYDYDCLVTGSSMVENFRKSWVDSNFQCQSLKAPFSGAYALDIANTLQLAFQKNIKLVIFGLDINMLINNPQSTRFPLPEYLYDNNIFNDVNYVLNKTVTINHVLKTPKEGNLETAYSWDVDSVIFSKEATIKDYMDNYANNKEVSSVDFDIVQKNMDHILPYIIENKETEFHIFFPPYSILYWYHMKEIGTFDEFLEIERMVIKELIKYENVKLYYFQNDEAIILNLDNYKDFSHYSSQISEYILKAISNQEYLLKETDFLTEISKLSDIVNHFNINDFL